jgi:hypothetical protein
LISLIAQLLFNYNNVAVVVGAKYTGRMKRCKPLNLNDLRKTTGTKKPA